MEIKNKVTVTRGEGEHRGKKGKGQVKDPWTKDPWTRSVGWGLSLGVLVGQGRENNGRENGDNYNLTTIKHFLHKKKLKKSSEDKAKS